MYNTNSQIKFKATMLNSSLQWFVHIWDYSDTYILVKRTIAITGMEAETVTRQGDKRNKQVTFKSCASFTDCVKEINDTQVDNAKDLRVVMPIYNLIECH